MIRQTEHEIKDVISRLTVGDKFTLYSKTVIPNNKQYRIVSYEDDVVCIRSLDTLKICGAFENIQACRHHLLCSYDNGSICGCVITNDNIVNNNHSNISSLINITNEDKVDLINYNSYIKLTDYTNTEYEYVVGTYELEYPKLYGIGSTKFNPPCYNDLDALKKCLKADIRSGKYTNIEVVPSLEEPSTFSNDFKNCTTNNSTSSESSNPDLYYPYKRYEIIQHKDYGIGIVNDNTFTFNNSRTSASCKFWNSFKWKYLNKYCTQKSISIYYPNITEIAKQKLDCFIIFKNVKTFKYLLKYLPVPYLTKEIKKAILNGRYKEQITKKYSIPVIQIRQGEIIDIIYVNNKWFANIKCYDINMSDNTLIDTNTHKYIKEESKMKKIFVNQTTEKRVNKTNNTKYDVITTEVTVGNINGKVTLSAHDKDDTKMAIMYAICNAVVGGNFDTAYDKYLKHKQEEENPIADRTCSYCGMIFNTTQEKEEHEKLEHIEKRKARHERYLIRKEAKRRLAEIEQEKLDAEREKAIEAKMKEMQKTDKKSK